MESASQFIIENIDEKVLKEVEKRKHCKNPFEDRFLNLTLSSFVMNETTSLDDDELVEIESSIMNASVNVSIRSELIKEMIKQTVKSVDHIVARKTLSNSSKAEKKDEGLGDELLSANFEFIFNEERYKAFKENDREKIEKYLSLTSEIEHISTNQKLEELPIPQSSNNHNYYVLNYHQSDFFKTSHQTGNEVLDHHTLIEIFQGFESVLEMEDEKVEELFALEGINIYDEIEMHYDDPMIIDNQEESTAVEENTIEIGGIDMVVEENDEEYEQDEDVGEIERERTEPEPVTEAPKPKEKAELKYYRIIDMDTTIERKKSSKQNTLRTKQRVEDNLIEVKPRSDNVDNGFFKKPSEAFNQPFLDPDFTGSLLFPNIDIIQLSSILSRSIEGELPERAMYELGCYHDCEYGGIDDYLFGNEISLLEDQQDNNTELGGAEMQEETVEVTVPRTKTIIDNLIENAEKKKIVPIVKISSIINDNLSNNQTTTLTEQYQYSHLGNQNVSKARFLMALLHSVHQTNIKGNAQITLSNVGEDKKEVKIVTRNIPAKTQ